MNHTNRILYKRELTRLKMNRETIRAGTFALGASHYLTLHDDSPPGLAQWFVRFTMLVIGFVMPLAAWLSTMVL
jgi:hypothetical protein